MNKYIAEYLRLSDDDGSAGESNSITSQRQIIENYISTVCDFSDMPLREFIDDGHSGTNFNRPGVKRLLEAVRKGEVSCIIVKDFSRFGRQYLEVSKFIEQIFPYLGVRFIAVNDHYDSNNHKGTTADIDVPIRNMINAMYSKDISKKIKSAKQTQMRQGIFSNAFAPFGYKKNETDRHCLLIDKPAAEIVRSIFKLAGDGCSAFQIASKLNSDKVMTPAVYKLQSGSNLAVSDTGRTIWTRDMVLRILRDERYTGTFVGGKRENLKLGTGERRRKPKEAWIRVPDTHPAIISSELWDAVVANRGKACGKRGTPNTDEIKTSTGRILYKKVRCGYCVHVLRYIGDAPKPYYICDTARYTAQYGCGRERYRSDELIDTVRAALQSQIMMLIDLEKLYRDSKKSFQKDIETVQATATGIDNEISKLQAFKRQLYERYKSDALDKTAFFNEREAVEVDISAKTVERDTLLTGNYEQADKFNSAHQFLSSFKKYPALPEISDDMVNELVEAVYIYGVDKIEIKFSFADELKQAIGALESAT